MTRYISNPDNLKLMMNMLKEKSRNIQFEAFHVFKVSKWRLFKVSLNRSFIQSIVHVFKIDDVGNEAKKAISVSQCNCNHCNLQHVSVSLQLVLSDWGIETEVTTEVNGVISGKAL